MEVTPELLAELLQVGFIKSPSSIAVMARADFRCEYCGKDLSGSFIDAFHAEIDHIVPHKKGEKKNDDPNNLAATCVTCNVLKWTYAPKGDNRADRISDAVQYIGELRKEKEALWDKYRALFKR
jgi:5-methylcytosine-specific restriction endonuclease McrA